MTEPNLRRQCPYLGMSADRAVTNVNPTWSHRCYAQTPPGEPDLSYQSEFCLTATHASCAFFVAAPAVSPAAEPPRSARTQRRPHRRSRWPQALLWGALALALAAVVFLYWLDLTGRELSSLFGTGAGQQAGLPTPVVAGTPVPQRVTVAPETGAGADTATGAETEAGAETATPAAGSQLVAAEATRFNTPTAEPGGRIMALRPAAGAAGWWGSQETRGNHLGDSYLYAGYYEGQSFVAAARFDLTQVPRGAPIREAVLRLTGLETDRFNPTAGGSWTVHLLADDSLPDYARADFRQVFNAPAAATLFPTLYPADLDRGTVNVLPLDATALAWLEKQVLDAVPGVIVRITGPGSGETLFAWDSGSGPASFGEGPELLLNLAAPPPTAPPLPTEAVIVATLTPTPENIMTAAAEAWTATAIAITTGTATPLTYRPVTPTPSPANLATAQANALLAGLPPIVPHTPTPANEATATADALIAAAYAFLTGTPTATPVDAVTPIIITPTPQPQNVLTQAAHYVMATRDAIANADATPWPYNAIIATLTPSPVVVTYTPAPANRATAAYREAVATAVALVIGTYTPLPPDVVTPTPTSGVVQPVPTLDLLPPPATATPAAAPAATATATVRPPAATAAPPAANVTPRATADPALAASLQQTLREANAALIALIETPDAARDGLRAYFCGASAWGKVTFYLDGLAKQANRPTAATYTTTSAAVPAQDPNGRWQLREVESWTYTLSAGGTRVSNEEYLYWLVATPSGAPSGAPPFCIDDYAFQRAR